MSRFSAVVKLILKILLIILAILLVGFGVLTVCVLSKIHSCEQSNARRNELTEGRTELDSEYYKLRQGELKNIGKGVYEIPGIDAEDVVCSTVYWFGQPNGQPLKILLASDSNIKNPVLDISAKAFAVLDGSTYEEINAPSEYAELIRVAMRGDRHQGIEWSESTVIRIYLGENRSFYFQSSIYLYEAADGRGRVYFVKDTSGIYYEIEDSDGFYIWLDANVFVS